MVCPRELVLTFLLPSPSVTGFECSAAVTYEQTINSLNVVLIISFWFLIAIIVEHGSIAAAAVYCLKAFPFWSPNCPLFIKKGNFFFFSCSNYKD